MVFYIYSVDMNSERMDVADKADHLYSASSFFLLPVAPLKRQRDRVVGIE